MNFEKSIRESNHVAIGMGLFSWAAISVLALALSFVR